MKQVIDWFIQQVVKDNLFLTIVGVLIIYQQIFIVLGLIFKPKRYPNTDIKKTYGIVIPARNEEAVIGKLIESIHAQTYDQDHIKIFVVADNCTDQTALVARKAGAIVYERFNDKKRRKGWALEFLFEQIENDYGITSLDAYMVFDADNLLDPNFIVEMNKAFVVNQNFVTGYRNTKNFDTNIISSAYGIHFYRSTVAYHRPRSKMNLGTHIAGTGFVINSKFLKDGWKYHTLTEDTELTMDLSSKNVKIGFCEQAVFYDEQPTNFFVSFRQRVRWTQGRFVVFLKNWYKLLIGLFRYASFTMYDLFFYLFPWGIFSLVKWVLYPLLIGVIYHQIQTGVFWLDLASALGMMFAGLYLSNAVVALFVVIKERKSIHASKMKKAIAIVTYPWFNMISIFLAAVAIFKPNVKWTQIKHNDNRGIEDIIHKKENKKS